MGTRKLVAMVLVLVATCLPNGVGAQGSETIEIPLRAEDSRLIVPVEASDGSQLQFVVGTTYTGLSETAAARLGDQPSLTLGGVEVRLDDVPAFPDVVPGGMDEAEELRASLKRQRVILGELDPEVDRLVTDTHDSLPNIVMLRYRRRLEVRLDGLSEQIAENLVQQIRYYLRHPEMWVAAEELLDGIEEL